MTNSDPGGLVAPEGVDEGSADSAVEGPGSGSGDVLGPAGSPAADSEAPLDMESEESRAARESAGSGQQLAEGEG